MCVDGVDGDVGEIGEGVVDGVLVEDGVYDGIVGVGDVIVNYVCGIDVFDVVFDFGFELFVKLLIDVIEFGVIVGVGVVGGDEFLVGVFGEDDDGVILSV